MEIKGRSTYGYICTFTQIIIILYLQDRMSASELCKSTSFYETSQEESKKMSKASSEGTVLKNYLTPLDEEE